MHLSSSACTVSGSRRNAIINLVMSKRRHASEKGPIIPPSTTLSPRPSAARLAAFRYSPVRPAPTAGTSSAWIVSRFETTAPVTVGASLSESRTGLPKASASTDRSIAVNAASDG